MFHQKRVMPRLENMMSLEGEKFEKNMNQSNNRKKMLGDGRIC
jgi:hypothetical protein